MPTTAAFSVIDLETTGFSAHARIVEIGGIRLSARGETTKAKAARKIGTRTMTEQAFWRAIGVRID